MHVFWFIPTHGDSRYLGTSEGARAVHYDYLRQVATAADTLGYEGVLIPTGRSCEDPWVVASALAPVTRRLKFLVAVRPGLHQPALAARMAATFDRLSGGRLLINLVTGGDRTELEGDGVFLDHAQRYAQSEEFIRIWREILSRSHEGGTFDYEGEHLSVKGAKLLYPPVQKPHPPVYFGGSSEAAHDLAAEQVDTYLTWGEPPAAVAQKVADVRARARATGPDGALRHTAARDRARDRCGRMGRGGRAHQPRAGRDRGPGAGRVLAHGFRRAAPHGRAARRGHPPLPRGPGDQPQPLGRRGPGARRRGHGAGGRSADRGRAHAGSTRTWASTPSCSPAIRTWKRPTASRNWCSRCCPPRCASASAAAARRGP